MYSETIFYLSRVLGKPVRISELLDAVVGVQEEGAPAA